MARQKNYLNNADLLEEMYKSNDKGELTRKALDMLMLLAERTQRKLPYPCEDDKQQCLSEAYVDIWQRWTKFNPYTVRIFRFEMINAGDEFKFYKDIEDRSTLTKCKAVLNAELYIEDQGYTGLGSFNIDISTTKEGAPDDMMPAHKRKLPTLPDLINNIVNNKYMPEMSRVLVEYTNEEGEVVQEYITKLQSVVRDPNPFSYFTSVCVNGFAKGFKELKPKKDKGRFISLDAGFGSENGTDMYNA